MLIGQTIGNPEKGELYIERELGSGAMGTVYRATLNTKGKKVPVALKVVSLGLLGNESAMARFERESKILQQLRHKHIVRLYGTGKYRGTPYIAMEYVDGEPMDRMLTRRGRLGWEEVFGYGQQLCEALQHAHEKGIIHRDLKPSNLMIDKTGVLKLADFGIAKDTDVTALTAANSTIGTAAYMSPEQCRGVRELGARSDLYSLGICFYELITGKKPFYAETTMDMFLKHVNDIAVRPSKLVPDLPIWVDNLIMHLLEKKVEDRPLDADQVKKNITEIIEKVQTLQSAGAEVATARKIDRKLKDEAMTEEDREAARAIKGKKKKKKKATPLLQQPWLKGVAIGLVLLALVGIGVWFMLPESPAKALAAVKSTPEEGRLEAVRRFLGDHGSKPDKEVEEGRAIFKDLRSKLAEKQLLTKAGKEEGGGRGRKPQEGEDEAVMQNIWGAIDSERLGLLPQAAEHWKFVREHVSEAEVSKYPDEDAMRYPPYRWVAEKRLNDIDFVGKEFKRLDAAVDEAKKGESSPTTDPTNPEGKALRAVRLEKFGDTAKANRVWDEIQKSTQTDPDKLRWTLFAAQRKGNTAFDKDKEAAKKTERIERINSKFNEAKKSWEAVQADKLDTLGARAVRNACRDIFELYDDETDDAIKGQVANAKKLFAEAEKR